LSERTPLDDAGAVGGIWSFDSLVDVDAEHAIAATSGTSRLTRASTGCLGRLRVFPYGGFECRVGGCLCSREPMPSCHAPRVLLVDDAIDEREMYAEYFQTLGFCTLQATSAADGYRLAAEMHPAVVITEIKLAGADDGLSFARRLKQSDDTRFALVVVLSSSSFERERREALTTGCDRFMTKPCPPDVLAATVQELLVNRSTATSSPS
jgi:CheY-like chemotaxis protein